MFLLKCLEINHQTIKLYEILKIPSQPTRFKLRSLGDGNRLISLLNRANFKFKGHPFEEVSKFKQM